MKKRAKQTLCLIACAVVLLLSAPLTFAALGFLLPAQYDASFLGELKYKYGRLKETEGKRIVVVGGSSVAFGLKSPLIESEFNAYKAVNFGMYAALGTKVMLDLSRKLIREGDIVIISPEQNAQTLSDYFNSEMMWQALDGGFDMLGGIKAEERRRLAGRFVYFASEKFRLYADNAAPRPDSIYARASFDIYGDINSDKRPHNVLPARFDPDTPVLFSPSVMQEEFITTLNAYADYCRKRGAEVFYSFCPVNAAAVSNEEYGKMDEYYGFLTDALHFRVLGDPHAAVMDSEWFFDTNFHLNDSGAVVNTRRIVTELKAQLGDTTPTEIVLPDKPEIPPPDLTEGDDSDAGCFLFDSDGRSAFLTGLSEEGKLRARLTVPVRCGSLPVASFAPSVFSGNTAIEEITVQSNVTAIAGGSFDGCSALKKIIMLNPAPGKVAVTPAVLKGTKADFYVPAASLSAYKTDYFWSQLSSRIFPL